MDEAEHQARATSFGAGAAAYERSRPHYPDASVDWLLPPGARRVLDLGAGTGKLTDALVARGLDVVAVDPSPGMLVRLAEKWPAVATHEGSAESIPLPDASVDAIVVGQAWHWFDPARAATEAARVLRPGGMLGLIWNIRNTDIEWVARLGRIMDSGYTSVGYTERPTIGAPFGPTEDREETWFYPLGEAALLDLASSRSGFLTTSVARQGAMLDDIRALFDKIARPSHGDPYNLEITLPYVTRSFRATRP